MPRTLSILPRMSGSLSTERTKTLGWSYLVKDLRDCPIRGDGDRAVLLGGLDHIAPHLVGLILAAATQGIAGLESSVSRSGVPEFLVRGRIVKWLT